MTGLSSWYYHFILHFMIMSITKDHLPIKTATYLHKKFSQFNRLAAIYVLSQLEIVASKFSVCSSSESCIKLTPYRTAAYISIHACRHQYIKVPTCKVEQYFTKQYNKSLQWNRSQHWKVGHFTHFNYFLPNLVVAYPVLHPDFCLQVGRACYHAICHWSTVWWYLQHAKMRTNMLFGS